jgi:hypothetical protein
LFEIPIDYLIENSTTYILFVIYWIGVYIGYRFKIVPVDPMTVRLDEKHYAELEEETKDPLFPNLSVSGALHAKLET